MAVDREHEQSQRPDSGRPMQDDGPLLAVRRRGAFLITAVLWAAAAGGLVVLGGYFVIVFNLGMEAGERVRQAIGLEVPATGPDWYLIAVMALVVAVPVALVLGLWSWYGRVWRRRLRQVWPRGSRMRRYSRLKALPLQGDGKHLRERGAYLSALLASPAWQGFHEAPAATDGQIGPTEMSTEEYRALAEKVLREIEDDVAERAIATGLIVGVGPSRLDRITIVIAALEMQLHVLSRLGKKPSLGTWLELVRRTSASFFFNTYLNREETLVVSFTIRKMAMGLEMAAEMGANVAEGLGGDGEDTVSETLEGIGEHLGEFPVVGGVVRGVGSMAFGIGAFGLQQTADVAREVGNELLQGALAGGVLYYHGMAIAADALALDQAHRHSPAMTRTPLQGAMRSARVAGQLLRAQVRRYRGAFRQRKTAPVRFATRPFARIRRKQPQQGTPDKALTEAPNGVKGAPRVPRTPPWSLWRRRQTGPTEQQGS